MRFFVILLNTCIDKHKIQYFENNVVSIQLINYKYQYCPLNQNATVNISLFLNESAQKVNQIVNLNQQKFNGTNGAVNIYEFYIDNDVSLNKIVIDNENTKQITYHFDKRQYNMLSNVIFIVFLVFCVFSSLLLIYR